VSTAARLAAFGVAVAAAFGLGLGAGAVVGPLDDDSVVDRPTVDVHDHGGLQP
jgi:hypothetical protein